jgi:hypothetical protein
VSKLAVSGEFAALSAELSKFATELADKTEGMTPLFEAAGADGIRYLCRTLDDILYVTMVVTPALARVFLEVEGEEDRRNRPSNKLTVEAYARDMAAGKWTLTGESFAFDQAGTMWNGGHRCRAILLSKASIVSEVAFGIEKGAVPNIDSGRARTNANYLHFLGEKDVTALNSAILKLAGWDTGLIMRPSNAEKRTRQEVWEWLQEHPDIRLAVKVGRQLSKEVEGLTPASAIVAVVILGRTGLDEEVEKFLSVLRTGANLSEKSAVLLLRKRLAGGIRRSRGRIHGNLTMDEQLAYIFSAWNRRHETNVDLLRIPSNLSDRNFPQPKEARVSVREHRSQDKVAYEVAIGARPAPPVLRDGPAAGD